MVVSLIVFHNTRRPKMNFPPYLAPFSSRFVILACCHPPIIVSSMRISFHPSGVIQSIFSLILPECLYNYWWCFSSSQIPRPKRVSFKSCPILCHPLIIVCEYSFHPSGAIQESFQFVSPEPIILDLFIPAFSSRSPNLTGASFKFSLISSGSLHYLAS